MPWIFSIPDIGGFTGTWLIQAMILGPSHLSKNRSIMIHGSKPTGYELRNGMMAKSAENHRAGWLRMVLQNIANSHVSAGNLAFPQPSCFFKIIKRFLFQRCAGG